VHKYNKYKNGKLCHLIRRANLAFAIVPDC